MLVIKNARVISMAGEDYEQTDILIKDKKIASIGQHLPVADMPVLDATGLTAVPGFIDAHTHLGCAHDAINESSRSANAEMNIRYAVQRQDSFQYALSEGVTTVMVIPGSGTVIGGLGAILKCHGNNLDEMLLVEGAALKCAFGSGASVRFGGKGMMPASQMGHIQLVRDWFRRAEEYCALKEAAKKGLNKGPQYNPALENIGRVLRREIPMKAHCEGYKILNVIRIAEEFDILFTLDHAFGAIHYLPDIMNAKGLVGVIFGPLFCAQLPGSSSSIAVTPALELMQAGIPTAIMTDYMDYANFGSLALQAGELTRAGAGFHDVLANLTIGPAKILGISDRVGSIEVGKDGDIALFDGIPTVDVRAKAQYTIVNGEIAYVRER